MIVLGSCEKKYFDDEYQDIYGKWVIRCISGGLSGRVITPEFDYLEIERKNSYSLFRDDNLICKGKIEIQNQSPEKLSVQFSPESTDEQGLLSNMEQSAHLSKDTLILRNDDCRDCYSYLFVRCEVFNDVDYIQQEKTLEYLDVSKRSIGYNRRYTALYFLNDNIGFVTCYDGSILKTTNCGEEWVEIDIDNTLPLYDISFINETIGFAVGGDASCGGNGCSPPGSIILKTSDGGNTWTKQEIYSADSELQVIEFASETKGFAIGLGTNLVTYDSGNTWEIYLTNFGGYIYELQFVNENIGFLSGIKGILFKTLDGGESWTDISLDISYQLYTVAFINSAIGYIGSYKDLMKTTDGGLSWNFVANSPSGVTSIYNSQEDELVVFGGREYSDGNCKVWDSKINFLANGSWQGDSRVSYSIPPFQLNNNKYFAINGDDELLVIEASKL